MTEASGRPPRPAPSGHRRGHGIGAGVGRPGFVDLHRLRSPDQRAAADEVAARIVELGLRTVRAVVVDQHGAPRSKWLSPDAAVSALTSGLDFSGSIYSMDTGNVVFPPPFAPGGGFGIPELTGFPDMVVVPDPATFKVLPWADRTGWMICDAFFANGRPVPLDPRAQLRTQIDRLASLGLESLTGLEIELCVFRRTDGGLIGVDDVGHPGAVPGIAPVAPGYQFLSEVRLDAMTDLLTDIRDVLWDLGVPPRSMEDEWGPGQLEITFAPSVGVTTADDMVLIRSAVKAVCARRGLLASFMCWPALPNFLTSGWHLHQSLLDARTGANVFAADDRLLSPTGEHFAAGLLRSARGMTLLAVPTINGIRRFRPYSFAPDRVGWALESRGALVRVQGGAGDAGTHLENRIGEPAANPYLYLAANVAAGRAGIEEHLEPPPMLDGDPYTSDAPALPATMGEAIDAFCADETLRRELGGPFVDYLATMKRSELARAEAAGVDQAGTEVSEWEMREYLEFF